MKYPTRIYHTDADNGLMWDRWEEGESLNSYSPSLRSWSFINTRHFVEDRRDTSCAATAIMPGVNSSLAAEHETRTPISIAVAFIRPSSALGRQQISYHLAICCPIGTARSR